MTNEAWARLAREHEAWLTSRVLPDQLLAYASNWHNRLHPNGRPAALVSEDSTCPTCGMLSVTHTATWAGHVHLDGKLLEVYSYTLCTGDRVKLYS